MPSPPSSSPDTPAQAYYPVCLDLGGRRCVVVGGGRVAERKIEGLLECGGRVTVISPELSDHLRALAAAGTVAWLARPYRRGDLAGAFLVIAATDDRPTQEQVQREAAAANLLLNVADVPMLCNFILPATVRRGDLSLTVSTGGRSPALAQEIRRRLEGEFGPEWGIYTALLGMLRPLVLAAGRPHEENKSLFHSLCHACMIEWIRQRSWDTIEDHFRRVLPQAIPDECLARMRQLVCPPSPKKDTE
ncbi:MAG: bifunctional precorrin-2 dehydrogenase/sirohydrochlorin ferrochelatase [Thermodesulfobacteriota bacterium]